MSVFQLRQQVCFFCRERFCCSRISLHLLTMLLCFHRMYELLLNGGTPCERGIEVDPSMSRRGVVSHKHYINNMIQQMLYLFHNMQCSAGTLIRVQSPQPGFGLCVLILHKRGLIVRAGGIQNYLAVLMFL